MEPHSGEAGAVRPGFQERWGGSKAKDETKGSPAGRLKVAVAGASGKMSREVLAAVSGATDMALVAAVSSQFSGRGKRAATPLESELMGRGVGTYSDLGEALEAGRPDVLVEFTSAAVASGNLRLALEAGVRAVSGTTAIPAGELAAIAETASSRGLGVVVIPNFSLGATVLSILARTAAPYFEAAEIVELHHDQKRDAPSGTSLALARTIGAALRSADEARPQAAAATEGRAALASPAHAAAAARQGTITSRGLVVSGVPVHSVRLQGLVAHHEILFASSGETLTLRHDSISRASFMPGVLLAVRTVDRISGLCTSLEDLLKLAGE